MLAKITLYDGTVYKIASQTVDTEDGIYLGRIKDELSLVSAMQEAGNAPNTVSLTIINYDNFIPHNKDLWAAEVFLTNDNGVSWRGKINFCNFDADGNLYVTASEKTAPELELQLPDEVRQVYTVDEDFHQSSVTMTIPLVIGGTTSNPILLPTILIDKTEGVYLICVGEIRSVVKVFNGVEELPNTAYTAYTGTSSQAEHAGFAYVKISEDYRLNADGSYAEINVEVVGLKLANFTEEECRNGALFLYYFLTTAATGINGWGCGISQNEIDTDSFQSAITLCNQLGYKLDGIMWLRQSAQSWIDQICQAIHGKYSINANGKRSLFIDYAGNASKKTFTASNMQVDKYGKNSYTSVVYNKGILSYDYNPITGLFMQSAQYENADSIAQIGEQKFVGESYLLKDPTTALAVLEYTCKRSQTAAEAIEFKTDDIDTVLKAGDVITINRPDLSINNALYQIQNISITDYEASISAVKFDTSVFIVSGTPSSVNWGNDKAITPALTPAQATNLLLSTGFDINPDGTGTPYISGTFTVPDGGWFAAAVQYGIGADPTNWTELALITDGRFKISPVNVGTVYSVRIRMITATGHSDYLRGQITATGDTTPPLAPTIAVNATDKTVTVQCGLDSPPYDFAGFQIYRKKSTESDSAYTFIGNAVSNRGLNGNSQPNGYASFTDYVSEYVTYNYKAKSYDRSGNLSTNFSNVATIAITGITANDVAATALAMPTGSILRLSAKNCTTASIAEANGVKDVSGNGNHGQAKNGVVVVQDAEMGDSYSFDGVDDYVVFNSANLKAAINGKKAITICGSFKVDSLSLSTKNIVTAKTSSSSVGLFFRLNPENNVLKLQYGGRAKVGASALTGYASVTIEANKKYDVAVVGDAENGKCYLYVNGVLDSSINWNTGLFGDTYDVTLGCQMVSNNFFDGKIANVRIYPRALSASEIKTIFMFPDDVTFGQLTSDLIGANIIKAENLIKTESLITTVAQIDQAVVNNLNVSGNATFQSGLSSTLSTANSNAQGYVDALEVGGRNLLRSTSDSEVSFTGSNKDYTLSSFAKSNVGADTELTISFEAKASTSRWIDFYFYYSNGTYNNDSYFYPFAQLTTSYKKFVITDDSGIALTNMTGLRLRQSASKHGSAATGATIYIKNLKLEIGNKGTSWTPSPEDVDASIASGDSSTLSSAKTYADGKASTAQSNAEAAAASALAAVTNNIYYTGTTKINGGIIQTGSIGAAAIAANSITANKLNVTALDSPQDLLVKLSAAGITTITNGSYIPDSSGNGKYGVATGVSIDNNAAMQGKVFSFSGTNSYISLPTNLKTTTNRGWTVHFKLYYTDNPNSFNYFFDVLTASTLRIGLYVGNSGVLGLTYDGDTNTSVTLAKNTVYDIILDINAIGVSNLFVDGTKVLTKTISTGQPKITSAAKIGARNTGANGLVCQISCFEIFDNGYSTEDSAKRIMMASSNESGQITADRIATDAIKSRNYEATASDGSVFSTYGSYLDLANGNFVTPFLRVKALSGSQECQIGPFKVNNDGFVVGSGANYTHFYNNTIECLTRYSRMYATLGYFDFWAAQASITFNGGSAESSNNYDLYIADFNDNRTNVVCISDTGTKTRTSYSNAVVRIDPQATTHYGLYVAGKARINTTDYGSDEKTKKDFQDVSTLDKLKKLRVCAWRFDEEKLVEKDNEFIDAENLKIEAENKAIDAENAEIEKENELRKNRKDGGEVELLPLKERKKLREHRIADKNANHPLNIGCMAGEFNKAFGTNDGSEDCLSVTDTIGVCMRAIQELAEISDAQRIEIDSQKAEIAELKAKLKIQQDEKSEIIDHFNELIKEPTDKDELVEPSFDELLENEGNQQEEQKK